MDHLATKRPHVGYFGHGLSELEYRGIKMLGLGIQIQVAPLFRQPIFRQNFLENPFFGF